VPTTASSYYVLWRNADALLGAFDTPEAVMSGTGNPLLLIAAPNAGVQGFYRVQEEPLASLLDLDGDTMPDACELNYPFLDPLDANDGATDVDSDSISNAQEYAEGTDPSLPPGVTIILVTNEVDYDQPGTGTNGFFEIFNPAGTLAPGEYLVIGSATVLANLPPTAKALASQDRRGVRTRGAGNRCSLPGRGRTRPSGWLRGPAPSRSRSARPGRGL